MVRLSMLSWLTSPDKKTDLVDGSYEIPAEKAESIVAVKRIDMLGEEVLVTKKV